MSKREFEKARTWIQHLNDVPVLAAAVKAKPDWFLTDNTSHFNEKVSERTGLRIVTPALFLEESGRIFMR